MASKVFSQKFPLKFKFWGIILPDIEFFRQIFCNYFPSLRGWQVSEFRVPRPFDGITTVKTFLSFFKRNCEPSLRFNSDSYFSLTFCFSSFASKFREPLIWKQTDTSSSKRRQHLHWTRKCEVNLHNTISSAIGSELNYIVESPESEAHNGWTFSM